MKSIKMSFPLVTFILLTSYLTAAAAKDAGQPAQENIDRVVNETGWKPHACRDFWNNMTPEQKTKHRSERDAMREKMKKLNAEERKEYRAKHKEEMLAGLMPEQRDAFKECQKQRKAMWEKFRNMSPEERKTFKEKRWQERLARMTPEQREAYELHRKEMQEKFKNMSPEEREAFRKKRQMWWLEPPVETEEKQ